jgi:hypothetical protein
MSVRWTNRFWSVSLEHTLFLIFLKLFMNMRLAVSFAGRKKSIFWTYGSKVMDVWSFKKKYGQGGHVLQPMRKSWLLAQKVEGRKQTKFKKNENIPIGPGVNPRLAGDRWSPVGPGPMIYGWRPLVARLPATSGWGLVVRPRPGPDRWSMASRRPSVAACRSAAQERPATSGRPPAAGQHLRLSSYPNFFWNFLILKKWIFGSLGNGPGLLGEWVYDTPIFWSLPLHLEVLILPKFMESGDFIFFPNFFPKFRVHLDLHIYRWDFCFMKKLIH